MFCRGGAVAKAAERARRGEGPTLIEAKTYRCLGIRTPTRALIDPPGRG